MRNSVNIIKIFRVTIVISLVVVSNKETSSARLKGFKSHEIELPGYGGNETLKVDIGKGNTYFELHILHLCLALKFPYNTL